MPKILTESLPTPDNTFTCMEFHFEFIGTFAIVYLNGLANISYDMGYIDLLGVSVCSALVVGFFIHAVFEITGGDLNPAVSLAFWISRHKGWKKMLGYILAQFCGSMFGGCLLRLYVWGMKTSKTLPSVLGYPHADINTYKPGICFMMEAISTFFLMLIIYMCGVNRTKTPNIHGTAIGAYVAISILGMGNMTGSCINPFRMLGPAIVSGELFESGYSYAYIYYVAPFIGGAACGIWWRLTFTVKHDENLEKLVRDEKSLKKNNNKKSLKYKEDDNLEFGIKVESEFKFPQEGKGEIDNVKDRKIELTFGNHETIGKEEESIGQEKKNE